MKRKVEKDFIVDQNSEVELPRLAVFLRDARLNANLQQAEVAEEVHLSPNTISAWECGTSRPDLSLIPRVCELYGVSLEAFFGVPEVEHMKQDEKRLISIFRDLSKATQVTVQTILDTLHEQPGLTEIKGMKDEYVLCREIVISKDINSSAGEVTRPVFVKKCKAAILCDLIFPVIGISMSPAYPNRSKVYVRTDLKPAYGEAGVFIYEGVPCVKIYEEDGLHSVNTKFPTIILSSPVVCIGKVIGVVNPLSIAQGQDVDTLMELFEKEVREMGFEK